MFFLVLQANALENIKYKNLQDRQKIMFNHGIWSKKVAKNCKNYYIKKANNGILNYSEFYSPDNQFLFSTATEYEFIYKGSLIAYSNSDLKFYEFNIDEQGILQQRELALFEVQDLFPKFQIIDLNLFSQTHSIKLKKRFRDLDVILINTSDGNYNNYGYYTNNARFENYDLKGFLKIKKKGMIQFSKFCENSKNSPWYVLLVR